jgi:predicted MFS family arabinose efflux permease
MTQTSTSHPREPLITRTIGWFLLFSFMANGSLSILFSALPLYADQTSGRAVAAGLTTGVMMVVTVVVELGTPQLMSKLGYRRVMELGAALLALPALLVVAWPNLATILLAAGARGAGLAFTVVAGTALAARLFPPERRGEGLGIYGLVVSIPAVVMLPAGLWLSDRLGFTFVATTAAALGIIAIAAGRTLPAIHPGDRPTHSILTELRDPGILRPTIIFSLSTLAIGILVTYLALAVPEDQRSIAAIGLLVQAIFTSMSRWGAGRLGDQVGSSRLLGPAMLLCAIGVLCLVATSSPFLVLTGMAIFGLGLGGAQNASLAIMFARASRERYAQISVIWNIAYDAGMGIGAVGFGVVTGLTGYSWGFTIVAVLLFASVIPAWRDHR